VNVDVNRALELRAKGLSIRAAAREMKIGAATLQRALSAIGVDAMPEPQTRIEAPHAL
jgi:hypothetical protein